MTDHDAIAARVRQDRETGTPGPWHHDADDQRRIDYTDPRSGTWNVAYVHSHCGYPIDGSSANARRIAALPDLEAAYLDLYDEVKRLRAALEIITMMHDGNPPLPLADMPSVEYARRTIRNIHQEARAALKGTSE